MLSVTIRSILLSVIKLSVSMLSVVVLCCYAWLKVHGIHTATSRVENSTKGFYGQLKIVYEAFIYIFMAP
jgi:hypothetical protein